MQDLEEEIWKDIPGYEGLYQCSSHGQIKSLKRLVKGRYSQITRYERILKPSCTNGYKGVNLCKNNNIESIKIHQLVAITFLNHTRCKFNKIVDHIDNNKLNNKLSNLQVISQRENTSKNKTTKCGLTGVYFDYNRWRASIKINGKTRSLGAFQTKEEAHSMYLKAVENIHKFKGDLNKFKKQINP